MAGESCLLGTNIVLPLGLMLPGPGVETREAGKGRFKAGVGLW